MADFDLAIIGAGPAGLTAGLYAARANMNAVLFDAKGVGGEILNTDLIEDYPGFASITGRELAEKMAEHATKFGLKIDIQGVTKIRSEGDKKIIEMADGAVHTAVAVILTVGGEPIKLGVPGEEEFNGKGVSYCAVCDGAFFKGADLAVVGGGDSAFQEGLFLTRFGKKLYVVHRRSTYRAQAILQERLLGLDMVEPVTPAVIKEIGGENVVQWMDVDHAGTTKRIPVDGVFIFVGFKPLGRELFEEHIDHDKDGYILTDSNMRTNIPGVYAAGDCRAQLARQITTAVGDATTALLHAERYIEELKHAQKTFPNAPREKVALAASRMETAKFAAGETIIDQGAVADRFYVITQGRVEVVRKTEDGTETELNRLGPGDYFGEVGLLTGASRNATARAATPVEALVLDKSTFNQLVQSSQTTAAELHKVAESRR